MTRARRCSNCVRIRPLAAAVVYLALDTVVVIYTPSPAGVAWNWTGKLASIALAVVAIAALRLRRDEVGLVMPDKRCAVLIGIAIAFHAALNVLFATGEPTTLETVLFQATMPGLAEELAYRGVAFALVRRAFDGASAPAIIITTLAFGLAHGFALLPFLFAAALGGWFAWIRTRSGSVLGCVIAHNAANIAGTLAATI
jgi:membrane protease YdiL (CAAX protease family)